MIRTGSFILPFILLFLLSACEPQQDKVANSQLGRLPVPSLKRLSQNQYGIELDSRTVVQANFKENQFLTDILSVHNVSSETIDKLAKESEHIFDVRKMRAGNAFTLLKNEAGKVDYFIYEKNPADYVVFDLRDSVKIYEGRNKTESEEKELAGLIQNSIYETISHKEISKQLAPMLEDVFAWSVDLFHLEKGDYFKVIYKEEYVDDASLGITQILAAQFHHDGEDYYAFRFGEGNDISYFDRNGNDLKTTFLKAPVRYNFSSPRKAPKGEDTKYDAPKGSPVYAIGGGTISRINKTSGYSIKIAHTSPYSTQYQHISRLAKGIKRGLRVKQGDLIGYVGDQAIGLRFMRRNKTIERSELSLTSNENDQVKENDRKDFEIFKENMILRLAQIPLSDQDKQLLSSYR